MLTQEEATRWLNSNQPPPSEGHPPSLNTSDNNTRIESNTSSGNVDAVMTEAGNTSSTMNYEKASVHPIPHAKYTMVVFPGNIKNVNNAIQMLGGMKSIQSLHEKKKVPERLANSSRSVEAVESSQQEHKFLECRFRPNNLMSCHPVYGDVISTNHLLVKIRRKKVKKQIGDKIVTRYDPSNSEMRVIGTISKTVNFKGMSDFQYIQPKLVDLDQSMDEDQNTTEASNNQAEKNFATSLEDEEDEIMENGDSGLSESLNSIPKTPQNNIYYSDELSDVTSSIVPSSASLQHPHTGKGSKHHKAMLDLPPPIFSRFDMPMDYAFKQNPLSEIVPIVSHDGTAKKYKRLIKKNKQYTPHCVEINFEDEVPMEPPPEVTNAKDKDLYGDMEKKLRKLFGYPDEGEEAEYEFSYGKSRLVRPMWSRSAITSKFESRKDKWKLRVVLPRIAYHYRSGPWRMLWVRYGYDPKKEISAAYYQLLDFRIPQELRPKIHEITGKKKEDERETNKFRRLPKRRVDLHIDLHDYLYSQPKETSKSDGESTQSTATATTLENDENVSYEFNSIPTQIQVFYQLCDIRIAPAQNIILAEKDEKIPITYGVLLGTKTGEELGLKESVWNNTGECDAKSGWYSHHALEQIRHIMKKKIEEWMETGEDADPEILDDTDDEADLPQPSSNRQLTDSETTAQISAGEDGDLFIDDSTNK